ncbi:hypothetical protein Baya_13873 [Bagarius yarrelli]|uniref:Uncharacterized protein n=1 Tax=Bagarius yarrelli TaxID=175774 RepID=A0A556V7W7_BAGYA|nr:hypothetical protein Baya_13873 [Bagarius yarrelli]
MKSETAWCAGTEKQVQETEEKRRIVRMGVGVGASQGLIGSSSFQCNYLLFLKVWFSVFTLLKMQNLDVIPRRDSNPASDWAEVALNTSSLESSTNSSALAYIFDKLLRFPANTRRELTLNAAPELLLDSFHYRRLSCLRATED